MELVFPDVAVEDFDFSAEWLITAMNADNKQVYFEGHLDPETFLQAEKEPYKPQYEGF